MPTGKTNQNPQYSQTQTGDFPLVLPLLIVDEDRVRNPQKMPLALLGIGRGKTRKAKGPFRGSFPLIWSKSLPILASLSKPKSKPPPILAPLSLPKSKPLPTSAPLSLLKSKPPYLSLSFFKPRSKPYPQNYNLNLKRKTNKRKEFDLRGRER